MRFVLTVLVTLFVGAQGARAVNLNQPCDDEDRFVLSGTPRVLDEFAAISDTENVNIILKRLIEEFEGKVENPNGIDSGHLAVHLSAKQNVCRKGKQLEEKLFTYNCTVHYRADSWNGEMKAVLLVEDGSVTQLIKAAFDGFRD